MTLTVLGLMLLARAINQVARLAPRKERPLLVVVFALSTVLTLIALETL